MIDLKPFFGKVFPEFTMRKGTERQKALLRLQKSRASIQQMQPLTYIIHHLLSELGQSFLEGGITASQKAELQFSPLPDITHSGPTETKFWTQFG